jgi:hypothetical protein
LSKGKKATASLWAPLQSVYGLVHQGAQILANPEQHAGVQVRERYLTHVRQMQERKAERESLAEVIDHFCHITENFAPGLFYCYDVKDLPRTNNELEHCFGVARVHERRATGRRGAIPGVVTRCVSSLPWFPKRGTSPPRSFAPAIISVGATSERTCSSKKKSAGGNSAFAKIPPPIWRLWKLSYSSEVCHSAAFFSAFVTTQVPG